MNWARMESTRGFLVYVSRMYKYINPYLKGLNPTLDGWRTYRDEEGWQIWGEELKIAKLNEKWEGMKEVNKNKLMTGAPFLRGDLLALGRLTKDQLPPQSKLIAQRQAIVYLMGYPRIG